jgi:hypothetical protein
VGCSASSAAGETEWRRQRLRRQRVGRERAGQGGGGEEESMQEGGGGGGVRLVFGPGWGGGY